MDDDDDDDGPSSAAGRYNLPVAAQSCTDAGISGVRTLSVVSGLAAWYQPAGVGRLRHTRIYLSEHMAV